jgi:hypothetical protein
MVERVPVEGECFATSLGNAWFSKTDTWICLKNAESLYHFNSSRVVRYSLTIPYKILIPKEYT